MSTGTTGRAHLVTFSLLAALALTDCGGQLGSDYAATGGHDLNVSPFSSFSEFQYRMTGGQVDSRDLGPRIVVKTGDQTDYGTQSLIRQQCNQDVKKKMAGALADSSLRQVSNALSSTTTVNRSDIALQSDKLWQEELCVRSRLNGIDYK